MQSDTPSSIMQGAWCCKSIVTQTAQTFGQSKQKSPENQVENHFCAHDELGTWRQVWFPQSLLPCESGPVAAGAENPTAGGGGDFLPQGTELTPPLTPEPN